MSSIAPPSNEDVTIFPEKSTIDTCSIWNVLSLGNLAFQSIVDSKRFFIISEYVKYECFYKNRGNSPGATLVMLRGVLIDKIKRGRVFLAHSMALEDLQEISRLIAIKQIGLGELASIVVANKIRCGFMTEDGPARTLAKRFFSEL